MSRDACFTPEQIMATRPSWQLHAVAHSGSDLKTTCGSLTRTAGRSRTLLQPHPDCRQSTAVRRMPLLSITFRHFADRFPVRIQRGTSHISLNAARNRSYPYCGQRSSKRLEKRQPTRVSHFPFAWPLPHVESRQAKKRVCPSLRRYTTPRAELRHNARPSNCHSS